MEGMIMSGSVERMNWQPGMPRGPGMTALLARNWWAIAIRGVAAVLFGIIALLLPAAALSGLVLVFAVYMLVDGVFAIVAGLRAAAHHERWGLLILEGVLDILIGLVALAMPLATVLVIVMLIGAWAVVTGVLMIVAAFNLHASHGRWMLAFAGLVSLAWGVLLLIDQLIGAVVLTIWLGAYALVFGISLLAFAIRLRRHHTAPA
jgi:uncharacterized membrane protein HdeD (DUF308 family)